MAGDSRIGFDLIMGWPAPLAGIGWDRDWFERERNGPMDIVIVGIDLGKD